MGLLKLGLVDWGLGGWMRRKKNKRNILTAFRLDTKSIAQILIMRGLTLSVYSGFRTISFALLSSSKK